MPDVSQARRDQLAKQGKAMPGGRFPIESREDLENAIRAVGRAKGGEAGRRAVRLHIVRRARALKLMSVIPDSWDLRTGALKG